jgi:hypothetical protein
LQVHRVSSLCAPAATPARSIGGNAVRKRPTFRRRVPDGEDPGPQGAEAKPDVNAMLEARRRVADPLLLVRSLEAYR